MNDIPKGLAEPFAPHIVSFRVGPTTKDKTKGMALAYVDARDVMRRLDEVCGPENWQDEYPWSDGKRVVCRIGIKVLTSDPANPDRQYEWVWKADGAGDTDTEGEKGALSDAFKRAAVKWGVGRYLYDVEAPWVEIEQRGQSYVIKPSELSRLRANIPAPRQVQPQQRATPQVGTPFDAPPPRALNKAVLPLSPEEPPEVDAARQRIRGLIDKYIRLIGTAPSIHALNMTFEDGQAELREIEEAGDKGKAAAKALREKFMKRISELEEMAA